jgi:hypothetical protein
MLWNRASAFRPIGSSATGGSSADHVPCMERIDAAAGARLARIGDLKSRVDEPCNLSWVLMNR